MNEPKHPVTTMTPEELQHVLDVGLDFGILTVEQWREATIDLNNLKGNDHDTQH